MPGLVEDIQRLIRTRHAIVTIRTGEEEYVTRLIIEAAHGYLMPVLEWSLGQKLHRADEPKEGSTGILNTDTLLGALMHLHASEMPCLYILKDTLGLLNPACIRQLREVAAKFCKDSRTLFLVDADGQLPAGLKDLAVPFELPMPDEAEIRLLVRDTYRQTRLNNPISVALTEAHFDQFVQTLRGLTRREITQVLYESMLDDDKLDAADLGRAVEIKRRQLGQEGVLEFLPASEKVVEVGGMSSLRAWLKKRAGALSREAEAFGLEPPRGILLLGVQGCGKSLMAKYVAGCWSLPLLRMNVGALYDKFVGESERHLRRAFEVAGAMSPCVLWIDEIEKAFASASAGAAGAASDGGLSQRMFGQLLTWMQDRLGMVFLVATANDIQTLPPELLRKGRFDEVFFVDLPIAEAREEILRIHLARRKRDPAKFSLPALAAACEGFSGAEIEQAVVASLYAAFAEKRDLTDADLLAEVHATRPLSVLMSEKIADLRAWARGRCVPAD